MRRRIGPLWRCVFVCVVALLIGASVASAQGNSGIIQGVVTDAGGRAIQGASVAIVGPSEVTRTVVTGADGKFSASGLSAGTYTVQTSAVGFGTDEHHAVVVAAGQTAQVTVSLAVASVSEEVTVEAEGDTSLAAQLSPVKSVLDAGSART